jgi:hypothetical protein
MEPFPDLNAFAGIVHVGGLRFQLDAACIRALFFGA